MLSDLCASRGPWDIGVMSVGFGDWGIGGRPESRIPPCSGMSGVISGDERGAAEIAGETAGSMFGENMMEALRGPTAEEDALRTETSDDARLRACALALFRSMCVGALPRCSRWWDGSCEPCSRARRAACRCCSRMNPWNRFFSTHFPIFTVER